MTLNGRHTTGHWNLLCRSDHFNSLDKFLKSAYFFALLLLSSCTSNYFADPIVTPIFSAPWQGEIQGNIDVHKLSLEGAYSLPLNLAIAASRESWGSGLANDQEMTSFAAGRFWYWGSSSALVLAGFGFGSHRISNALTSTGYNAAQVESLTGINDFRRYFLQFSVSRDVFPGPFKFSVGAAARVNFLDQFRFYESAVQWYTIGPPDSNLVVTSSPHRSWQLDLAGFISAGFEYVQIYGQLNLQLPFADNPDYPLDIPLASAGVRFSF